MAWLDGMAGAGSVDFQAACEAPKAQSRPGDFSSRPNGSFETKQNHRDGMASAGWVDFRAAWVAPKTMSPNDAAMLTVIACVTVQKIIRPSAFLQSSECVSDEMVSNR